MIRVPAQGNDYRWRVSVAQIDVPGPFSDFSGYHRLMVLLQGSGVRLAFECGRRIFLRDLGDFAEFDGGLAAGCELLGGPCSDLNLIVSKSAGPVTARVEKLEETRVLVLPTGGTSLVFGLRGVLSVDADHGPSTQLAPWDLAVAWPGERATVGPASAERAEATLVFIATVDDNPR